MNALDNLLDKNGQGLEKEFDNAYEQFLIKLFKDPSKWLEDKYEIFLRVATLDSYYGTHLFVHRAHDRVVQALYDQRKNILDLLNARDKGLLNANDDELKKRVDLVCSIAKKNQSAELISHASKVLGFISPKDFPLYDGRACTAWSYVLREKGEFRQRLLSHCEGKAKKTIQRLISGVRSNFPKDYGFICICYRKLWGFLSEQKIQAKFLQNLGELSEEVGIEIHPLRALDKYFYAWEPPKIFTIKCVDATARRIIEEWLQSRGFQSDGPYPKWRITVANGQCQAVFNLYKPNGKKIVKSTHAGGLEESVIYKALDELSIGE